MKLNDNPTPMTFGEDQMLGNLNNFFSFKTNLEKKDEKPARRLTLPHTIFLVSIKNYLKWN